MANENQNEFDYGVLLAEWQAPEYHKHERSKKWYVFAGLIALLFLAYSIITSNFLFALIVIITGIIIIINDSREPENVSVAVTSEGVAVGKKFYDYDELKEFSIVYKPNYDTKNLYFEFQNSLKPRLSIPLGDANPLPIRDNLLQYLPEDLERANQPASEGLAKLFKL